MSDLIITASRVALVTLVYLFLLFVALAVRRHVSAESTAKPSRPEVRPFTLSMQSEGGEPRIVEVVRAIVVGRSPEADVTLADGSASGRHARFEVAEGKLCVEDLGSTNGTFVNGRPATGRTTLAPGDTVDIGETVVKVQ
jgi:pSer/pThr/pTyr-binding forkhead associated (FHA) protein